LHYVEGSIIAFGPDRLPFDKYINVNEVYKFDPGVERFAEPPLPNSKFDAIIAIQSLTGVPDEDFPKVVAELMAMTNKFCFVGHNISVKKAKAKKGKVGIDTSQYFKENRDNPEWWKEQFKDWQGSELVLKFI
jgi:hypothetical protein